MSKKCDCTFCIDEYPEYKKMLACNDVDKLHAYIEKIFEHWQMECEEAAWYKAELAGLKV